MSNEEDIVGLQPCGLNSDFAAFTETHGRWSSSTYAHRSSHRKTFGFIPVYRLPARVNRSLIFSCSWRSFTSLHRAMGQMLRLVSLRTMMVFSHGISPR